MEKRQERSCVCFTDRTARVLPTSPLPGMCTPEEALPNVQPKMSPWAPHSGWKDDSQPPPDTKECGSPRANAAG